MDFLFIFVKGIYVRRNVCLIVLELLTGINVLKNIRPTSYNITLINSLSNPSKPM